MEKLSTGQLQRASEALGNIAVAWFSAGVISPILIHPKDIISFLITFGISLVMALVFFVISLTLIKGVETS